MMGFENTEKREIEGIENPYENQVVVELDLLNIDWTECEKILLEILETLKCLNFLTITTIVVSTFDHINGKPTTDLEASGNLSDEGEKYIGSIITEILTVYDVKLEMFILFISNIPLIRYNQNEDNPITNARLMAIGNIIIQFFENRGMQSLLIGDVRRKSTLNN